ncbi:hypothetical protein [Streptacidiphilus sp. EB129]|uniref:hypothetical protein n=1 Tax=Streptacidiphilus sp. EB129 TaxID=3156262 RepID=UPI003516CC2B
MTTRRSRGLAAAGLLSLGALLLSSCSSAPAATTTAQAPASASSSGNAQMQAYRQCLSQHGVTLPTGRPSGHRSGAPGNGTPGARPSGGYGGGYGGGGFGGASADPATQAAMQACASLRPKGGFGGGRGGGNLNSTAMAAFSSCMKDHGITLPATGGLRALNTTDPKTAAAYAICKALLPTRSPAPAASPTA